MEEIKQEIILKKHEADFIQHILCLTGKQIYKKYGIKRNETITFTAIFGAGIEADIKLVIPEWDETPYTEGVLFEHGSEITCTDVEDSFLREWFFLGDKKTYVVMVKKE